MDNNEISDDNIKKSKRGRKSTKDIIKTPKKRGRKPKAQDGTKASIEKTPKKRGRKPQSKIYTLNKNSNNEVQTNITSNLILHLKINSKLIKKECIKNTFMEDKLLQYTPGLDEPKPFDPNNSDNLGSILKDDNLHINYESVVSNEN